MEFHGCCDLLHRRKDTFVQVLVDLVRVGKLPTSSCQAYDQLTSQLGR